jgi:PAS domain S-box-containing protein
MSIMKTVAQTLARMSPRKPQDVRIIASLAALIAVALLLLAAAVYLGSIRQDALQLESEQRVVALNLRSLRRAIVTNVRDYAWWNDAVRHLALELDEAWADANVGPYVYRTFDYDVALVVGSDGRPRIGWLGDRHATDAVAAALGPALPDLVAAARQPSGPEPKAVSAVLAGPRDLFLAAASPIVPQPGSTLVIPEGPPALLVFAKRLDQAFLGTLQEDLGLRAPRFAPAGTVDGQLGRVALEGPSGEVVRQIAWKPRRAGHGQLVWLIPALLGSLAVFSLFTRLVLNSIRRSTTMIRESEARFRDIAEAASDWIWETDRRLRLTYVSEHFRRATGLRPEHVLGKPLHDVLELPDQAERDKQHARLEMAQPFRDVPCELHPSHGEARTLRVAGKPVHGADGVLLGYRGTATDITVETAVRREVRILERKALEDLAAAKAELERLNADLERRVEERTHEREVALAQLFQAQKMEAVGKLTGGVAHDFNNLLMAVLTNLDLLGKRLPDEPAFARLLSGAVQAAERGATLTQRLLAFARRQDLQPRPVDLPTLVRGLEDLLQRSVGPLVRIEIQALERLPPAKVDPHQLELALLNLAVNARDAMPTGGRLTLALTQDRIGAAAPVELTPGPYLRIDVIDDGSGMDAVTLQRAIEPFFSTKGPGKGTGLGLSMVHGLAVQSGGALHLRSQPGVGTTASLWLPLAEAGQAAAEEPTPRTVEQPSQHATILVVDDDMLVRMGTVSLLEELGHTVVDASDGPAALEILRERGDIDLVVTDYAMPGMNGVALVLAARERRPGLPALLVTGYVELPANSPVALPRLIKPYREVELAACLAQLLPWLGAAKANVVPLARRRAGLRPAAG